MQLTFLQADQPLTKTYEKKQNDSFVGGAYPGVTNFTSIVETVITPAEFCEILKVHANKGHCLLTNSLTRQIVSESRAKLSDKDEKRKWVVLDIDGIENVVNAEDFIMKCLPVPFHQTSYVVQHSPSSGIKPGCRVHIFFLLEDEVDVTSVSAWLKYTNLETQQLSNQITLSNNSMALSLKLDWVANNNGRIIYITPPECKNFDDPIIDRIHVVEKKYNTLSFNFAAIGTSQMRAKYKDKLNELRAAAGLKISRKTDFYVMRGDKEIVHDSLVEPARITSYEADNERFMRCNIDGGDSFAYYYYRHNPLYLHNFKGEPCVKLKLLDPDFYDRVAKPDWLAIQAQNNQPFVFRDETTDKYFAGIRKDHHIIVQPNAIGSVQKIEHYFAEQGVIPPDPIPTWNMTFNPTIHQQWNGDEKLFNTWRPTKFQQNTLTRSTMPSVIQKVITHVTGNDADTYERFLNWLAYIFQTREKTGTAWVIHGIPGTGKGLLYHNIIVPLLGQDYCQQKQLGDLTDKFNGWMEQAILINIDEACSGDLNREAKAIVNALKSWITEQTISIRHMQATARNVRSFCNFLFTTNDFGALPIQEGDRRFNVAPRQEAKLAITQEEVAAMQSELSHFAGFLHQYEVDIQMVHTAFENQAKQDLKVAAESSIDTFFRAIAEGDLEYFIEGLEETETSKEYTSVAKYKEAVDRWIADYKAETEACIAKTEELKHAFIVLTRDKGMKTTAFKSMCAKRGIPIRKCTVDAGRLYGIKVDWTLTQEAEQIYKLHLKQVSPINNFSENPYEIEAK